MKGITRDRLPSPAIIVAIAALVAALGGAAVAQPVANKAVTKKKVKKIADKEIAKKAPGLSVAHADTAANADAVGGQSLANIAIARSDPTTGAQCDPNSMTFVPCADVTMTLPHEGRVLLVGTGAQYAFNGSVTQGNCRMLTDGVALGGSVIGLGNQTEPTTGVTGAANRGYADGFSTTLVTDPVSAGPHTFALQCNETDTDVEFENPQISAALLGSG
jgi:hypothetical protein